MDDITFENYLLGVDVHEEIFAELDRCKEKLNFNHGVIQKMGRGEEQVRLYGGVCSDHSLFCLSHPFF